jgi:PleD family two-component response regulator
MPSRILTFYRFIKSTGGFTTSEFRIDPKQKDRAKILVVDDITVVRDVVSRMLCLLGHEVSSADSGE